MGLPAVGIIRGEVIGGPKGKENRQSSVFEADWKGKDHGRRGLRGAPYGKGVTYQEQQNEEWYTQPVAYTQESTDRDTEGPETAEQRRQDECAGKSANNTKEIKVAGSLIVPRPVNATAAPIIQGRVYNPTKGRAQAPEWNETKVPGKSGLLEKGRNKGQKGSPGGNEDFAAKIAQIKSILHTLQAQQMILDEWQRKEPELQYQRNWTANTGKGANPWGSPHKHTTEGSSNPGKARK